MRQKSSVVMMFVLGLFLVSTGYAQQRTQKGTEQPSGSTGRQEMKSQKLHKASQLIGLNVKNHKDESLGEIKDVVIDYQTGRVSYVVLSHGGALGVGEKLFAVPLQALTWSQDGRTAILQVEKEKLASSPGFDKNNWPETAGSEFRVPARSSSLPHGAS